MTNRQVVNIPISSTANQDKGSMKQQRPPGKWLALRPLFWTQRGVTCGKAAQPRKQPGIWPWLEGYHFALISVSYWFVLFHWRHSSLCNKPAKDSELDHTSLPDLPGSLQVRKRAVLGCFATSKGTSFASKGTRPPESTAKLRIPTSRTGFVAWVMKSCRRSATRWGSIVAGPNQSSNGLRPWVGWMPMTSPWLKSWRHWNAIGFQPVFVVQCLEKWRFDDSIVYGGHTWPYLISIRIWPYLSWR